LSVFFLTLVLFFCLSISGTLLLPFLGTVKKKPHSNADDNFLMFKDEAAYVFFPCGFSLAFNFVVVFFF